MGDYARTGYHDEHPWERHPRLDGKYCGVELEIAHTGGYHRILELLPDPAYEEGPPPVTEEDGSLSSNTSLEIVFPPYQYADIRSKTGFFSRCLDALREGGASETERTGMHLNINISDWTPTRIAYFHLMLDWLPLRWFERLGGRLPNTYCQPGLYASVESYGVTGGLKYRPVRIRNGYLCAEVRFPHATLDHDRVILLLDFLEVVTEIAGSRQARGAITRHLEVFRDRVVRTPDAATSDMRNAIGDIILEALTEEQHAKLRSTVLNGYNYEAASEDFSQAA